MTLSASIDAMFARWTGDDTPGAVVAVTRHGEIVHEAAYGMADIAHGIKLDSRSVLRIGSQSKQFTVLLALLLEAAGKLSLDDEVHRHVPWLPAYPAPITLRQMAGNTSGLRDFLEIMIWSGLPLSAYSTRQTSAVLLERHVEVNYPPDQEMLYSNSGFFLLSEIIEHVSGQSFNELLVEHITGPLGMTHTSLQISDADILPRLAEQHLRGPDGHWQRTSWGFPLGGEGGMVSSLRDMLIWQANLARPLPAHAAALAEMQAPRHYRNGTETLYRLGLAADRYRGLRSIGHGGGTAGCKSEGLRFPDQDLGIVILGNAAELAPFTLARRIADVALADAMAPVPAPVPGAAPGLYRHVGGDDLFEILPDGSLTSAGGNVSLIQSEPGVFVPERVTMHLSFRCDGDELDAIWCGAKRRYRRLPDGEFARDIGGRYANAALGLDARVSGPAAAPLLQIRSDFGALNATLSWIDADLLTVGSNAGRPWLATLQVSDGGLRLTSDRTKQLRLDAA